MAQTKFPYSDSVHNRIKRAVWMPESCRKSLCLLSSCRRGLVCTVISVLALLGTEVAAQEEIAPFRLTNVNGQLSVRYFLDERGDTSASERFATSSARWQEEFLVRTRSYIYHPALLEMFISAGSILGQSSSDSNAGSSSERSRLIRYDARLSFLRRKAYPFTVFFRQDNPEVATGLTGRFNTVNNSYGITGRLRRPLLPFQVNWNASHLESKGAGLDTTVDSSIDRASLNTSLPYKRVHNLRLDLNWSEQESRSGSPGLPIRETLIETLSRRLTADNIFGEDKQIRLNQSLDHRQEERAGADTTGVENLNYTGNLNWEYSDRISSNGSYRYFDSQRDTTWSRGQNLQGGTQFRLVQGLTLGGSGRLSSDEKPDFSRDSTTVSFRAGYGWTLPFGQLEMTGLLSASRTDQSSTQDTAEVFEESVTLNGLVPVLLQEEFVVTSSVTVTNVALTQVFIEDIDYRLVTIGSTTTLERLVTGNIIDGQEVLVSYDYRTGGTVEYDGKSRSVSANLSFSTRGSLFVNLSSSSNDVLSGTATTPLNDRRRFDAGGRIAFPFTTGWSIGGEVRYTEQDEDISPFVRTSFDTYVQLPRYWNTHVRIGISHQRVDYEISREGVDRLNLTLSIDSRLPGGLILAYRGTHAKDEGGSIFKENQRHTLRLDWRYRLVIFSLNAIKSDVGQGVSRRDDTQVRATLRRYF